MRRWVVIVVATGALVVVLLGWRSFQRMMNRKQCAWNGGHWNSGTLRCEPQP